MESEAKKHRTESEEEDDNQYLLAYTKRGGITLHKMDMSECCHKARSPEVAFSKWHTISNPLRSDYSSKCRDCFRELRQGSTKQCLEDTTISKENLHAILNEEVSTDDAVSSSESEGDATPGPNQSPLPEVVENEVTVPGDLKSHDRTTLFKI